jgi:hypothetical protein
MERIIFTRPRLGETAHMAGFDQDIKARLTLMQGNRVNDLGAIGTVARPAQDAWHELR